MSTTNTYDGDPTPESDQAELERYTALGRERGPILTEFLDWLESKGYVIARWEEDWTWPRPAGIGGEQLLREHFEIDSDAVERARRRLLNQLTAINETRGQG